MVMPFQNAFEWKTCKAINDTTKLSLWYADNLSEYGKLWDPTASDGTKVKIKVPCMIALPLQAAKVYHQFKEVVMPHELLEAVEVHFAVPETSLDTRDDWGLVQKWLLVAAQKDGGNPTNKSFLAFQTDALLSNDNLNHHWTVDCLDATLGRRPNPTIASTAVGMQENVAVVHNMSGIIAMEVGHKLGVAMQQTTKGGSLYTGSMSAWEDANPYTQDHQATLLGFHGAMSVMYLKKVWPLFKSARHQTTTISNGPSRVR